MGAVFTTPSRPGEQQQHQQELNPVPQEVTVACDDCGRIIRLATNFDPNQSNKRCDRCAARVTEERVAQSPYSRKCAGCQMIFTVSATVADLPAGVKVNCQRCADAHRQLIQDGSYLEVILHKEDKEIYICCPKNLSSDLKRYMQNTKLQGYGAITNFPINS